MNTFTQCTHSLVVLMRPATLYESGWDKDNVCRRPDVFAILDRAVDHTHRIPRELGFKVGECQWTENWAVLQDELVVPHNQAVVPAASTGEGKTDVEQTTSIAGQRIEA